MLEDVVVFTKKRDKWIATDLIAESEVSKFIKAKGRDAKYILASLRNLKKTPQIDRDCDLVRDTNGQVCRMEFGVARLIPARPSDEEIGKLRLKAHERLCGKR